ncbi:MAG: hypothetical protein WA754_06250, partial [Pseudolabrys sp.]
VEAVQTPRSRNPKIPVTRRHFALDFAFESVDGKRAERDYGARRGNRATAAHTRGVLPIYWT